VEQAFRPALSAAVIVSESEEAKRVRPIRRIRNTTRILLVLLLAASATPAQTPQKPKRPGVKAVQVPFASVRRAITLHLGGHPDWMVITKDSVWIANDQLKAVQRVDVATNRLVATIALPSEPCSGLVFAFGTLWVPLCGEPPSLVRIDPASNQVSATLAVGPADSEGGIAASDDSVWLVTGKDGTLTRIDPATNALRGKVVLPGGSFNPLFSSGVLWITGNASNVLTAVDPASGAVVSSVPVHPGPRFLTSGGGSIWTLNQGDGTVSRISIKRRRVMATIKAGIPGLGGEICFGGGSLWLTVFDIPVTRIDPQTNRVQRQWTGPGGDSVRYGRGSLWLTDYKRGLLWRIPLRNLSSP
jgi:streptogramin lyase